MLINILAVIIGVVAQLSKRRANGARNIRESIAPSIAFTANFHCGEQIAVVAVNIGIVGQKSEGGTTALLQSAVPWPVTRLYSAPHDNEISLPNV